MMSIPARLSHFGRGAEKQSGAVGFDKCWHLKTGRLTEDRKVVDDVWMMSNEL